MRKKPVFMDAPEEYCRYDTSKIVIVPVPYDGTSTWQKGADRGPDAIIEASCHMYSYDIETNTDVLTKGIFTDEPVTENSSPESMTDAVHERVKGHLDRGKFVVTVGGEHSVSVGAARAHQEKYNDLSVLQLDAHADLQPSYEGSPYNHACVMARIKEFCPVVQAGMRSMDQVEMDAALPGTIFFARDIYNNRDWVDRALEKLTGRVYITIDVDAFDISIMPATGTPEPGGLLWYDVLYLLKRVAGEKKIAGFDLVELCPNEYSKPYDFTAARVIYKLLTYSFF